MNFQRIIAPITFLILAMPASGLAKDPRRISVLVVNEQNVLVEGASVTARYLQTVYQDAKEYTVPMELARPQTTNEKGRCELLLHDAVWTLAGIHAIRPELTTEEAMKLCDQAPDSPPERAAFDRELRDRCQRFSAAYQVLSPETDRKDLVTLKLVRAVKVNGRVEVNDQPLAKSFVTIYSPKTPMDQLFPRSAPVLTDQDGQFQYYSFPGELNRGRIQVERSDGNHVLELTDILSPRTESGVSIHLKTESKDYVFVKKTP